MKLNEMMTFIESRIRLSRLQERVLRGCWKRQTYAEIAREHGNTELTVRHVAYLLWKALSKEFGEKVSKGNLHQVLNKHYKKSTIS